VKVTARNSTALVWTPIFSAPPKAARFQDTLWPARVDDRDGDRTPDRFQGIRQS
jgi:hypothetical protein